MFNMMMLCVINYYCSPVMNIDYNPDEQQINNTMISIIITKREE